MATRRTRNPRQHLESLSSDALECLAEMRLALSAPLVLELTPRSDSDASYTVSCGAIYRGFGASDRGIGQLVKWGLAAKCEGIGGMYAITRDGLSYAGGYKWIDD